MARLRKIYPIKMYEDDEIDRAAAIIRQGGLVAFPTETVYGLGANAFDPQAVERIYQAKHRPSSSPLIVHVADREMARSIASEWPAMADALADRFWPGPLTLVVKKNVAVPEIVTAGLPSVAIRVPSHPIALELIRRAGVPIAAPSANRFTHISPTTAEHVRRGMGNLVDLILDGGPTEVGIESSVVSLVREQPALLRPGMITSLELKGIIGVSLTLFESSDGIAESPGMHPRHYAPKTPFFVLQRGQARPKGKGSILDLPLEPAKFAELLYAAMHRADAEEWDWIGVNAPPQGAAWAGIRDRLQRAATRL